MKKKYTVFVSSTYEDLKEERQEVMQTLLKMDCIPCAMELFPASNEEQFEFIKKIINDCDYFVLILAGKYGSTNQDGVSYTELEFKYALENKIPIISFIHENLDSIPNSKFEHDEKKAEKLKAFIELAREKLCNFWTTKEQLAQKVSLSMNQLINDFPAIGWVRADLVSNKETLKELYDENQKLKKDLNNISLTKKILSADEQIDVAFSYTLNSKDESIIERMTLNEILKLVGSKLIENQPRYVIEEELGWQIEKKYSSESNSKESFGIVHCTAVHISEKSMNEILLKLLTLKYIDIYHTHFIDNQNETKDTYSLTESGRDALLRLSEE